MYIGVWYVYDYNDSLGICRSRRIKETEKPGERQRNKEPSPLLPLTRTRMRQRPGPSPGRPLLQQVVTDIVGNHRRQRVQGFSRFDAEKPPNLTDYIIRANKTEMTFPKKKKKKTWKLNPSPTVENARWATVACSVRLSVTISLANTRQDEKHLVTRILCMFCDLLEQEHVVKPVFSSFAWDLLQEIRFTGKINVY